VINGSSPAIRRVDNRTGVLGRQIVVVLGSGLLAVENVAGRIGAVHISRPGVGRQNVDRSPESLLRLRIEGIVGGGVIARILHRNGAELRIRKQQLGLGNGFRSEIQNAGAGPVEGVRQLVVQGGAKRKVGIRQFINVDKRRVLTQVVSTRAVPSYGDDNAPGNLPLDLKRE